MSSQSVEFKRLSAHVCEIAKHICNAINYSHTAANASASVHADTLEQAGTKGW